MPTPFQTLSTADLLKSIGSDSQAPFDPYLVWAELSDWKGFSNLPAFAQDEVTVIAELNDGTRPTDIALAGVELPKPYRDPLCTGGDPRPYITARVRLSALKDFRQHVKRFQMAVPAVSKAAFVPTLPEPVPTFTAAKKVWDAVPGRPTIAVIDDGCAFYNKVFRDPLDRRRTRVRSVWVQGRQTGGCDDRWQKEVSFGYGYVIDAAAIDGGLARIDAQEVTAAEAYETDGYLLDPRTNQLLDWTHGTAVLDLAAGNLKSPTERRLTVDGVAPLDCDIHFVHLPDLQSQDVSGGGLAVFVLDAVRYVLARTPEDTLLVINLSYGALAGPHNGSSLLEAALDDIVANRKNTAIVIAAGNGRLSQCHWGSELLPEKAQTITWTLGDRAPTNSFLDVWAAADAALEIAAAPNGDPLQPIAPDSGVRWGTENEPVGLACRTARSARGSGQHLLLALTPRTPPQDGQAATPGTWRISITNRSDQPVQVDAYVERSKTWPRSLIDAPRQSTLDPFIEPGTLSNVATGTQTIVVGAVGGVGTTRSDAYSGEGPSRGARVGPDVAAPVESKDGKGLVCAGVLDGSIARQFAGLFDGTSAAAPLVTRWVAESMGPAGVVLEGSEILDRVRGRPGTAEKPDTRTGYRVMS